MARSRHVSTETAETVVLRPGFRAQQRRRAVLEERLASAIADGDAELVSRIREALDELAGEDA